MQRPFFAFLQDIKQRTSFTKPEYHEPCDWSLSMKYQSADIQMTSRGKCFSLFCPTSCSVLKVVARLFRIEQVSPRKQFITSCLQEKGKTRDEEYSWRLEMASTERNRLGRMLPCVCSVIAHRVTRYHKAATFTLS